jgi:Spy/CpxP family protein refolding chaperone
MRITNKWKILVAALSVFVLGIVAGGLSVNVYRKHWGGEQSNRRDRGAEFRKKIDALGLTPDQSAKVDTIFTDTRAELKDARQESLNKVSEIRKQARAKLQEVLTPEQWKQLEESEKKDSDQKK